LASPEPQTDRWYFGAAPDLVLGCGAFYFAVFAAMYALGDGFRAAIPLGLLPLALLFTSLPHYGATLLRVGGRPEDRRAYGAFTAVTSLVVAAALTASLQNVSFGSWMLTLYLTWSPWHYSGQNYGITLMFLRRRGVAVTPGVKRLLYASFLLSFALIALSIHGVHPADSYAPVSYDGTVYRQISLGIPDAVRSPALLITGLGYAACLAGCLVAFRRRSSWRDLLPALVVLASQSLWFAIPALARYSGWFQGEGPLATDNTTYAFVWVAVAHSVQYLWVTSYYAQRAADVSTRTAQRRFLAGYAARVFAAGAAVWVLPALVFAPGWIGEIPFDAGLGLMVAAAVNLHHFVLDGVIWKLRDARIARILVRDAPQAAAPEVTAEPVGPRRGFGVARFAPLVWAVGFACIAVFAFATVEYEFGVRRALARGDAERAAAAAERLRWIGRDSAKVRMQLGLAQADDGNLMSAVAHGERGVALFETAEGWGGLGSLYAREGRVDDAVAAYRRAMELDPDSPAVLNNLAWIRAVARTGDPGAPLEADELARRASRALDDRSPAALDTLAVALAAAGQFENARRASLRAIALARAAGDEETAAEIESRLALYRQGRAYSP